MWILVENTYGNNTKLLRNHHKLLKQLHPIIKSAKIGIRRFQQLYSAFDPNLEQLKIITNIIRERNKRYVVIII